LLFSSHMSRSRLFLPNVWDNWFEKTSAFSNPSSSHYYVPQD
jgi:hypothetical protein